MSGDLLACGCRAEADHSDDCVLGRAEIIAVDAFETAATGTHPVTAALIALTDAGILKTTVPIDHERLFDIVAGLLDDLYESGQLGEATS